MIICVGLNKYAENLDYLEFEMKGGKACILTPLITERGILHINEEAGFSYPGIIFEVDELSAEQFAKAIQRIRFVSVYDGAVKVKTTIPYIKISENDYKDSFLLAFAQGKKIETRRENIER